MNKASEKNGNGEQENIGSPQSINQSKIKDSNLKNLIKCHPELGKDIEETDQLINSKLEIQTITEFDETLDKISKLGYLSPEKAWNFIIKQIDSMTDGTINNYRMEKPKLFLDAKKYIYYYYELCNFAIKEEQLKEMIEKLVIAEINTKKQDEFPKIKIRIMKTALSNFKIKTTEHFYRFVDKVIDLEQVEKTTEKTQEQNDNLLDNKNKEALPDNFNTRKINHYKSVLKNFKINTMDQFDEILNKMTQSEFKTIQEAQNKAKTDKKAKKFCFYYGFLCSFINERVIKRPEGDKIFNELDNDGEDCHHKIDQYLLEQDALEGNLDSLLVSTRIVRMCNGPSVRRFLLNEMKQLIVLNDNFCLEYIRRQMETFNNISNIQVFLLLFSNPDRYNFFLKWHKMLEENLPADDKQLFYNYLTSCLKKLQHEKDNYKIFNRQIRNLTGIFIFRIIASAMVLTINLLEIYAAMCFFWFGIVGVVLTVAAGIRLFLCIKEKLDDLKKLENDLQKEDKTIQQKINEIDHAIEVYDLNKIKNLKKQELEIISMLSVNKNNKKTEEINTDKQNNNLGQQTASIRNKKNCYDEQDK